MKISKVILLINIYEFFSKKKVFPTFLECIETNTIIKRKKFHEEFVQNLSSKIRFFEEINF